MEEASAAESSGELLTPQELRSNSDSMAMAPHFKAEVGATPQAITRVEDSPRFKAPEGDSVES